MSLANFLYEQEQPGHTKHTDNRDLALLFEPEVTGTNRILELLLHTDK